MAEGDFLPSKQNNEFKDSTLIPKPLKIEKATPAETPGELPPPPPPPKIWTGGLEFGVNGTDGNTEVLKIRLGADLRRETASNLFTADFVYGMARQVGLETENKALFNARDEILFADSPWSIFASTNVEYDRFRAFDFRVGVYAGVGYQWLKSEATDFRTRAGAGAVREIGGPRDRWVPEALLGYDLVHSFTERQRFVTTLDFYPNLEDAGEFRVRTRAAYEILVDPSIGLNLRLGIQDRYDSNPGPAKRNDIDYFVTLLLRY
jgi:hypothetical protein